MVQINLSGLTTSVAELEDLASELEQTLWQLIDRSSIPEEDDDQYSSIVVITPYPWRWAPLGATDLPLLGEARRLLDQWLELAPSAIRRSTPEAVEDFDDEAETLKRVVARSGRSYGPMAPTLEGVRAAVTKALSEQRQLIRGLPSAHGVEEALIVADTNTLLGAPDLAQWQIAEAATLVLVPQVVRELDQHKTHHRTQSVQDKARKVINQVKEYGRRGDTFAGVPLAGNLRFREVAIDPDMNNTLPWLRADHGDDRLLANVLELKWANLCARVVLVTGDRNLQNKARLARVHYVDA